ncbi:IBR domain protein [Medicago truncatula]|uniref:IBR domain protein n=2 Tax=Medicago truncatula TaxID=3880 RepID=G7K6G5_MEDTR|nr:IBR domain protein [Medicago truncatula]
MSFLNSIKQAANNLVTKVEDLFSLHDVAEKKKKTEILLSGDKYIWGNCPFKNCSVSLLNDEIKIVTNAEFPSCHKLFCAQCKIPWHGGHNCQRFQQRENRILKKRKSFFKDRDDEKKRKKVTFTIDQPNQNSVKVKCNEFQQQNLKRILKCSVTSNEKELKKETIETSCECSSLPPKSFCGLCFDFIQDSDIFEEVQYAITPFVTIVYLSMWLTKLLRGAKATTFATHFAERSYWSMGIRVLHCLVELWIR